MDMFAIISLKDQIALIKKNNFVMITLEFMKKLLLILFTLILIFGACTSKEEKIKKQDIQTKQTETESPKVIKEKQIDEQTAIKESLRKKLLESYPTVLNVDSVRHSFTYVFQNLLEKSSSLLYLKDALIRDVEAATGYYIVTVYNYFPQIAGKFKVYPEVSKRLLKELNPKRSYTKCCIVVKVRELMPIKTDVELRIDEFDNTSESSRVSEDDIRNNVHISFDSEVLPFYFIKGDLIDFYLL